MRIKLLLLIAAVFFSVGVSCNCHAADATTAVDPSKPGRLLLHVCEIDGTPIRPLVADVDLRHKLDRQGTPVVSADGKRVAFDAWSSGSGFSWQESRIVVVDFDGKNAVDISDGVMPSFSPDGINIIASLGSYPR